MVVCNHLSYLDPFVLAAALPAGFLQRSYWGGWTGAVFNRRWKYLVARLARAVPIDPLTGARRNLAYPAAILQRGHNLIWFAEGGRSRDGRLQPFREGIGQVLQRIPVAVLPVAIQGTHEVMPVGQSLPRSGAVRLRFGEPVDVAGLVDGGDEAGMPARITKTLHDRVGALLD